MLTFAISTEIEIFWMDLLFFSIELYVFNRD